MTISDEALSALLKAANKARESVCSLKCPSVKREGEQWTHHAECLALKDAIYKVEGEQAGEEGKERVK